MYCAKRLLTLVMVMLGLFGCAVAAGEPQSFRVIGVDDGDVLNVRAKPTVRSSIVARIAASAQKVVGAQETRRNGQTVWQRVRVGRINGWVNAKYLEVLQPAVDGTRSRSARATPDVAPTAKTAPVKRVALVVGNGSYSGDIPPLKNAPNDGRDMAKALTALGFDVVSLIDGDLESSRRTLETFRQRAQGAQIAMLFFAGHGLQVNGENYLLPTSAQLEQPEDLLTEAIALSEVMAVFRAIKPALAMIILDACRNNPQTDTLAEDARSRGLTSLNIRQGLAKRSGLPGMMIVYSTNPDNVASDGAGRNSPFTKALLASIAEPEVEVRLMFGAVRDAVVKATGGRQTPWMEEAVLGRFFFKPPPKVRPSLFYGKWLAESWTLEIEPASARIVRPPFVGEPPTVLTKKACGDVFERSYSTIAVDQMQKQLGNPRIEQWARKATTAKTVRVMKIVCAYRANRYFFFYASASNLLVARFSEQDWLLFESVYQQPR